MPDEKNGYVKLKIFIGAVTGVLILVGVVYTRTIILGGETQANEVSITKVETNESNHYSELKGTVDKFDKKLDDLLLSK